MKVGYQYDYPNLIKDVCLVIDENDISPLQKQRLKKKLKKLARQDRLNFQADSLWIWRLAAARLMRGEYDTWYGFEFRSKWASAFVLQDWIYKKWDKTNGNCVVLAEQGVGDEIVFASTFGRFLTDCPDGVIEADHRLLPVFKRAFPQGNFISRWVDDEKMIPQHPENYEPGKYEMFVPAADLLKVYLKGVGPTGEAYLKPDPQKVEDWKRRLADYPKPHIGLSWAGGRSYIEPELLRREGKHFGIQYRRDGGKIVNDPGPEWVVDLGVDHNDFDSLFALVAAFDEVVSSQSVIVHIAGSQGKRCHAVKPPPQHASQDNPDNNRLKWYYGIGSNSWTMPFYKSVTVYQNHKLFQELS